MNKQILLNSTMENILRRFSYTFSKYRWTKTLKYNEAFNPFLITSHDVPILLSIQQLDFLWRVISIVRSKSLILLDMPADRNFYEYHVWYFISYHQVVNGNSFFDTLFETNQSKKKTKKTSIIYYSKLINKPVSVVVWRRGILKYI